MSKLSADSKEFIPSKSLINFSQERFSNDGIIDGNLPQNSPPDNGHCHHQFQYSNPFSNNSFSNYSHFMHNNFYNSNYNLYTNYKSEFQRFRNPYWQKNSFYEGNKSFIDQLKTNYNNQNNYNQASLSLQKSETFSVPHEENVLDISNAEKINKKPKKRKNGKILREIKKNGSMNKENNTQETTNNTQETTNNTQETTHNTPVFTSLSNSRHEVTSQTTHTKKSPEHEANSIFWSDMVNKKKESEEKNTLNKKENVNHEINTEKKENTQNNKIDSQKNTLDDTHNNKNIETKNSNSKTNINNTGNSSKDPTISNNKGTTNNNNNTRGLIHISSAWKQKPSLPSPSDFPSLIQSNLPPSEPTSHNVWFSKFSNKVYTPTIQNGQTGDHATQQDKLQSLPAQPFCQHNRTAQQKSLKNRVVQLSCLQNLPLQQTDTAKEPYKQHRTNKFDLNNGVKILSRKNKREELHADNNNNNKEKNENNNNKEKNENNNNNKEKNENNNNNNKEKNKNNNIIGMNKAAKKSSFNDGSGVGYEKDGNGVGGYKGGNDGHASQETEEKWSEIKKKKTQQKNKNLQKKDSRKTDEIGKNEEKLNKKQQKNKKNSVQALFKNQIKDHVKPHQRSKSSDSINVKTHSGFTTYLHGPQNSMKAASKDDEDGDIRIDDEEMFPSFSQAQQYTKKQVYNRQLTVTQPTTKLLSTVNQPKTVQPPTPKTHTKIPTKVTFDATQLIEKKTANKPNLTKQKKSNTDKKKPSTKSPINLNILDMLIQSQKRKTETANHEDRRLRTQKSRVVSVALDQVPKRGKEREKPAVKKPTKLKKLILRDRILKHSKFLQDLGLLKTRSLERLHDLYDIPYDEEDNSSTLAFPTFSHKLPHLTDIKPSVVKAVHSLKFRDYCDQLLDKQLDENCTQLIRTLLRFQTNLYVRDPLKARMRRRLVYGLREVWKFLGVNKIKMVIMATNIERGCSAGGLEDSVERVILKCKENNVPIVFSMIRNKLGYACMKKAPVSVLGVMGWEGAEELVRKVKEGAEEGRLKYREKIKEVSNEMEEEEKEEDEEEEKEEEEEKNEEKEDEKKKEKKGENDKGVKHEKDKDEKREEDDDDYENKKGDNDGEEEEENWKKEKDGGGDDDNIDCVGGDNEDGGDDDDDEDGSDDDEDGGIGGKNEDHDMDGGILLTKISQEE